MKIIKRNGSEAVFDIMKIIAAVTKANGKVEQDEQLTPMQILGAALIIGSALWGEISGKKKKA